ncbi:MAG TPA: Gfo/Idh/MocA family oxidoreductase [Armatimonadetes bacterium]|nr:Gfo/Idh/MocA family oxidoreductase [Armatimonadota bacterium]
MRAPVGIAVLSFAHGHAYTYCDQLVKFDDAKLIVCWDDDEERGHEAAQRFGMRYTSNLDDALSDPNVDAVIVTSETNRHAELCIASAKAGKHILLQKPMALTLADCDAIIDAVRSAGVKFSMAFQMRHDPMNIKMRELIRQGAIGRVFLLRRRHCIGVLLHRAFLEGKSRWHVDPEKNMGMFMDENWENISRKNTS